MYICDMDLSAHIHYLLYKHDCVTVPGFGAFLVEQKAAYYDETTQLYFPPTKVVSFNAQLQSNDGTLASHLATSFGISYERAVMDMHQHTIAWKEKLQKGKLDVPTLGSLVLNSEGKMVFTPESGLNFLAASYALPEVPAHPISRTIAEQPAKPPVYFELDQTKSKRVFGYVAVAASVLALFAVGSNSFLNQQADAQWQTEQSLREAAREQAALSVYDLGELPTLKIELPKPTPVEGFHVIAGSFRSEANAQRLAASLQRKGYYDAKKLAQTPQGFYQVSFASFPTKREAYNAMSGIKRNNYPDAWVLKK
ncbi:MAG: Uncharacterised protein [Bacteroidota bacterium]|nr:MAG: Uncharacterised protein [Bacteroidota bacterium]